MVYDDAAVQADIATMRFRTRDPDLHEDRLTLKRDRLFVERPADEHEAIQAAFLRLLAKGRGEVVPMAGQAVSPVAPTTGARPIGIAKPQVDKEHEAWLAALADQAKRHERRRSRYVRVWLEQSGG